ncbi:flagellar biosynthetic protein FliQ [Mesorhizobium japonicum]
MQFLIKLVAVAITLAISFNWMGDLLLNYANRSFDLINQMRV